MTQYSMFLSKKTLNNAVNSGISTKPMI